MLFLERYQTSKTLTGEELAGGLELRLSKPGSSLLVRYRKHP